MSEAGQAVEAQPQRSKMEEALLELQALQLRRDSLKGEFEALVAEDVELEHRIYRAAVDGFTAEDAAAWQSRRQAVAFRIKQIKLEQSTLHFQLNSAELRIHNLKDEAAQLRDLLAPLEAKIAPGGIIDREVSEARRQLAIAQVVIDNEAAQRQRIGAQVEQIRAAIERIGA